MLENGYTCFETHLEGRVSQNVDIGLSLNFIACRSGVFFFFKYQKHHKSYPFFALQ